MADWKVNSKKLSVTAPDGTEFGMTWVGKEWRSDTPVQTDKRADQALKRWNDALSEGVDLLKVTGETCFGPEWIAPMANLLEINRTSIHRWMTKERPLTIDHPVWPDVLNAVGKCQAELQYRADAVKEFHKTLKALVRKADTFESGRHAGGANN